MANQQLVNYVQQCLNSGYSLDSIRASLIQNGYDQQDVDSAINTIRTISQQQYQQQAVQQARYSQQAQQQAQQQPQQQVQPVQQHAEAAPQLIQYIQQLLNQGYDINYIRTYLLNYGYNQVVVDAAINNVYGQTAQQQYPAKAEIRHTLHIPLGTILTIVLILAVIGAGAYFVPQLLKPSSAPKTLLDLELESLKERVRPGEDLEFLKNIKNLGAETRYDIILTYKATNLKTNDVIATQSETIAIETIGSSKTTIKIPQDAELGKYLLETTAHYRDQEAEASFSFMVYEPSDMPTCTDGIQNQREEGIDCGGPCTETCATCNDRIQNSDETGIDCGGSCQPCREPSCFDGVRNGGEEGVDCGGTCPVECKIGTCTDGQLSSGEDGIDCGGVCPRPCETSPGEPGSTIEGLSTREVIEKAKKVAEINQDNAIMLCRQLQKQSEQDECISEIAFVTGNSNYCGLIESPATRDSCYMGFAMNNNDFSVCPKITNPVLKQSCNSLAKVKLMQDYSEQGKMDELRDELGLVVNETKGIELTGNQPPIINPISPVSAIVGEQVFMQVAASDPDPFDTLTFSDNTELFDISPVSGIVDFTPAGADVGTHRIIIEVTDGSLSDAKEMVLEISNG